MRVTIIIIILNVCIGYVNTKYVLGIPLPLTELIDIKHSNISDMLSILTDRDDETFIYYGNILTRNDISSHYTNNKIFDYEFHVVLNDIFTFEFMMMVQTRDKRVFQILQYFVMNLNDLPRSNSMRCNYRCNNVVLSHNTKKKRVVIRRKGKFNGNIINIPMGTTKYFSFSFSTEKPIRIEEIRVTIK